MLTKIFRRSHPYAFDVEVVHNINTRPLQLGKLAERVAASVMRIIV